MKKPFCVCIATALLLSACNLVPDYRRPDAETPLQWHDKSLTGQASAVDPQWWQAFGSIELNRPVTEVLAYNYDWRLPGSVSNRHAPRPKSPAPTYGRRLDGE
ncbi:MAG: hypothetical protein ACXV7F_08170 [Methylomonas sp.]